MIEMQIYGPSGVNGAYQAGRSQPVRVDAPHVGAASQPQDQLEISSAGTYTDMVRDVPDIRQDRVAAIRAAIADGTYETADKMDRALSALLDEIA
jgi:negative regulator of flagellin synthesis FlgM